MKIEYDIWLGDVEKYKEQISKGEPIVLNVREISTGMWKRVKAIVSTEPAKGGKPAQILIDGGYGYKDRGKWYVKVLEELPEDDMIYMV
jgi:hypothetical protein